MKTANIRELKHATSEVLDWVAGGETVEITRRNEVVGLIVPPRKKKANKTSRAEFYQRLETLFHDPKQPMTGSEIVSYARGER